VSDSTRVGFGVDAHRLTAGRPLILGGIEVPYERGLEGHSDADVLTHAICDALLGAACLGDIGVHFPDSDPAYEGISSLCLLEKVVCLLRERGFRPVNVDTTVLAERPRLVPHFPAMRERLARVLGLSSERVSLKATTTEAMGPVGRGEGIVAMATCLIETA